MGAKLTKDLAECSASDLAECITDHLGPLYAKYATKIEENCVDGTLLAGMTESELQETLEDLDINNRLHGRVLTKEWKLAKQKNNHYREYSLGTEKRHNTTEDQYAAAAEYQITSRTPDDEVTAFDEFVDTVYQRNKQGFLYSAINLLSPQEQVGIASRLALNGKVHSSRISVPASHSHCVSLLLNTNTPDFVQHKVPDKVLVHMKDILPPNCNSAHYFGHVVRSQSGERVGMVCLIEEDDFSSEDDSKKALLQEMAKRTEEQLETRQALLQRNEFLKQQVNPNEGTNERIIASLDLPSRRFARLSSSRSSWFPSPKEITQTGKPRRSAMLPLVQERLATTEEEVAHLPADYFDFMDKMNFKDYTPVAKHDRERCAAVEAMGLKYMDPSSATAKALKNIVKLASSLLDVPLAEVTFSTHDKAYALARYMDAPEQLQQAWNEGVFTTIKKNLDDSKPFLCSTNRQATLCSYVAATERTFVVHDIHADESFGWIRDAPGGVGPKFYSGSPVLVHGQVLATLCVLDWRARPDFTKAHEIQQEQLAACVGREIENYMLRREMEDLESQRRLFASKNEKISPPKQQVAIIFTDVQGSTTLWETNPHAMQQALSLHDEIMRSLCGEFHGYEIATEGDAFHMAFHDSIDAVGFALKLQSSLHEAPWDDDILVLPDAAAVDGFRGLRVRVAIHFGPVNHKYNELSGRSEYTGETVHVAKSLEDLAVGGQIVVSQDAWRGAAYLAETKLGSPQVVDIGKHVLLTGKTARDGVIAKQLFQLLPSSLAYDYFGSRVQNREDQEEQAGLEPCSTDTTKKRSSARGSLNGRRFPPVSSQKRLSASFHDAPAQNSNIVTIAFVYTSGIQKLYDDASFVLAALTELITEILYIDKDLGGYQCQNTMLAFSNRSSAVRFGATLLRKLSQRAVDDRDLSQAIKVGIYEGEFSSMGPHQTSGRADYFGTCVNRAARVANACANGQVCVGVAASEEAPKLDESICMTLVGVKQLKGVQEDFVLYSCSVDEAGDDCD